MNLIRVLYCVYYVYPPVSDEDSFVTITRNPQDYLGCSKLEGMFLLKKHALNCARRIAKRRGLEILESK